NPDTKPDIKQFIQSPNRSSRNGAVITMVVMHCTEASWASTKATFLNGSSSGRQVSAHYVIDRNGDIYQMVIDSERANHCKGANSNSIGIEHVASAVQTMTAAQTASSVSLVRWLLQQYDIPSAQVYGHDFAPGYSGGGTSCPDALFGAHTQQAVQDWVNANVISAGPALAALPAVAQPVAGSQLTVTMDSLNVRLAASVQATIMGSLNQGDVVAWLATSPDQRWAKVQKGALTGWSSMRFLVDAAAAVPTLGQAGNTLSAITTMAGTSAIAHYNWPGRGVAPKGYIKGMALVYARVYCKLLGGDFAAVEMARANSGFSGSDALAHYAAQFHEAGMDNDAAGVATLRHLFVLMLGLGMRESSGKYCEGRDMAANNTTANTTEAGMMQTSFNARKAHPQMVALFNAYQAQFTANPNNPSFGFLDVFKEGVTATAANLKNWGAAGPGLDFQKLSKACPAFAAEFCAVGLRNIRAHWGPINNHAAEIRPEANLMFARVEEIVNTGNLCPV
ncbi:MAG: hypothetical protein JWO08_2293, partial [Verrucomicrobiaceae bacterium]|nr:hypothetical protein [Verrucomicrobiaceae bacterium]